MSRSPSSTSSCRAEALVAHGFAYNPASTGHYLALPVPSQALQNVVVVGIVAAGPPDALHPAGRCSRLDDRKVLSGILFVLTTGIAWQRLPQERGYGSGMTCWRRLRDWQNAGVFERLHQQLLVKLRQAGRLDLTRAVCDSASLRALLGATRPAQPRRPRLLTLAGPPACGSATQVYAAS
jgi:transposase